MEQLKALFVRWAGVQCDYCRPLAGGGSARRYYRLAGGGATAIGAVADDLRENEAFFAFTYHLHSRGMPVPELYAVSNDRRCYLQQDLGDNTLYGLLYDKKRQGLGFDAEILSLYRKALSDLDAIQKAGRDMDFSVAYPREAFDRRSMLWDLNYFKYYFLKLAHVDFDEERLENDFNTLADFLLKADCNYFLYRDFQGRNIMVESDAESHRTELYYIDYQGGRRGASQYDVASLLYSAKSDLSEAVRADLLRHYVDLHGDPDFMTYFWGYVLIRIMQTLGAYGYRGLYEKKSYFIESIPLALQNLRHVVETHPMPISLPELERVWKRLAAIKPSGEPQSQELTVQVQSFSYKQGLPEDKSGNGGGFVFDCRALPNPGRYEQYKAYTGRDRQVIEFLEKESAVDTFIENAKGLVAQSIEKYLERRFTHLSVSFGCTGGQHRSVYCAERIARWIGETYPTVNIDLYHREQD